MQMFFQLNFKGIKNNMHPADPCSTTSYSFKKKRNECIEKFLLEVSVSNELYTGGRNLEKGQLNLLGCPRKLVNG